MDRYFSTAPHEDVVLRDNGGDELEQAHRDAALDEALSCTFPASDPVALNFEFVSVFSMDRQRPMKAHFVKQALAGRPS